MKKQTVKILIATVMTLVLVFSMSTTVFAGSHEGDGASLYTMNGVAKSFYRDSDTEGIAIVQSTSSGFTPYIISRMTLQSASLGTKNYTDVTPASYSMKTVYDSIIISHSVIFPITTGKEYRVKIELSDEVNETKVKVTTYAYLTNPPA